MTGPSPDMGPHLKRLMLTISEKVENKPFIQSKTKHNILTCCQESVAYAIQLSVRNKVSLPAQFAQ